VFTNIEQGNAEDTGSAAQITADALRQLITAVRGVAACAPPGSGVDISPQDVISSAVDVLDKSMSLMTTAQMCVDDPQNPENKTRLAQVNNIKNQVSISQFKSNQHEFL
jgi:hypothetical protein